MDDRGSKQLGSFKIVQHSFPVLDIKVNGNEDVYVMTENCVSIYNRLFIEHKDAS